VHDYSKYDVLVSGIPKSGTNMTEKICRMLGASPSPHMHTANYLLAGKHKVAYVYRNPRNVLISAQRYQNHQMRGWEDTITEDKLIAQFFDYYNSSMPAVYNSYAKWLLTSAYAFKYESMLTDISVAQGLARYLGKSEPKQEFLAQIPGNTPTWTGKTSDWRDHWTDGFDKIWVGEGMLEIEAALGYDNIGK
jgi:hypothetical protein